MTCGESGRSLGPHPPAPASTMPPSPTGSPNRVSMVGIAGILAGPAAAVAGQGSPFDVILHGVDWTPLTRVYDMKTCGTDTIRGAASFATYALFLGGS